MLVRQWVCSNEQVEVKQFSLGGWKPYWRNCGQALTLPAVCTEERLCCQWHPVRMSQNMHPRMLYRLRCLLGDKCQQSCLDTSAGRVGLVDSHGMLPWGSRSLAVGDSGWSLSVVVGYQWQVYAHSTTGAVTALAFIGIWATTLESPITTARAQGSQAL